MFSIVIPTYNRAPILSRTLQHLFTLRGISECEVIAVNDGSTDRTAVLLEEYRVRFPEVLRICAITNGGPARARNHGLQAARRDRILFIDDDVFPRDGMLQSHQRFLDGGYTGSQGLLLWHPEITITPLIRYLDSRGTQFAFDQIRDPGRLSFAHVYTGNFAVSRKHLIDIGGFDEGFFVSSTPLAAFEDTILGHALLKNGARLGLNRDAVADHLHDMRDEEAVFRREQKVGFYIGRLRDRYPEIATALGHGRSRPLLPAQVRLLGLVNGSRFLQRVFGYSLGMRLRHREAFCRGLLQYEREASSMPGSAGA